MLIQGVLADFARVYISLVHNCDYVQFILQQATLIEKSIPEHCKTFLTKDCQNILKLL